jgi:hypothetical protein
LTLIWTKEDSMIDRRQLLSSTMAAGFVALGDSAAAVAPADSPGAGDGAAQSSRDMADLAKAVESMSTNLAVAITQWREFPEISRIRKAQKDYLLTHAKLPDAIEVGVNVWFDAYDWHIKWAQPVAMGRDANNRRTIALFETLVILQIDQPPNFVGMPYEFAR